MPPTGSTPRAVSGRERLSGSNVEKRPISSITTPEELMALGLTALQAQNLFENKDRIGTLIDLIGPDPEQLTEDQVNNLVKNGILGNWATQSESSSTAGMRPTRAATVSPESNAPRTEVAKQQSLLKRSLKAIIKPLWVTDKSKIGYGIGAAVGVLSKASWFTLGPGGAGVEMGLGGGAYALNFVYDRIAAHRINTAKTTEERMRREANWKHAGGFIRGIAAGYSATSLVNMVGTAVAPKFVANLYASEPFKDTVAFASQKASAVDAALRGGGTKPIELWWGKAYDAMSGFFHATNVTVNPAGHQSVVKLAGDAASKVGAELTKLGVELSMP